jgi:hypothetical protein
MGKKAKKEESDEKLKEPQIKRQKQDSDEDNAPTHSIRQNQKIEEKKPLSDREAEQVIAVDGEAEPAVQRAEPD